MEEKINKGKENDSIIESKKAVSNTKRIAKNTISTLA